MYVITYKLYLYVVYTVFQIPSWLVVLSSEPASKILIKDEKWHEYQHGIHQIIIPSKSCEGVLSLDSSSNIQQEYRQLLVRVLVTRENFSVSRIQSAR